MSDNTPKESPSSRALDALLDETGDDAVAMKKALEKDAAHRTLLWRYRTGKRKPDAETVAKIERITNGRVPANGWENIKDEAPVSESKPNGHEGAA